MADLIKVPVTGGQTDSPILQAPATSFQSQASFIQRFMEVTIALDPNAGSGQPNEFTGSGSNNITLSGFRMSAHIEWNGSPSAATASLRIYGLTPSTMNQLSVLGIVFNSTQKNTITISAGNAQGMTPIFGGTIQTAMANYNAAPNVPFMIEAKTGYFKQVVPVAASSFPGSTDVATIMQGFASQMQLLFENNGISKQIPPSYFSGTLWDQVQKCAKAAQIKAERVDAGSKLAIYPIGGSRTSQQGSGPIPLVSAATGMIGYPTFAANSYMTVKTIFNPQIYQGCNIQVQSSGLPQANATWTVQKVDLDLESLTPKGKWEMTLMCYKKGFAAPPPTGSH
jgi:hypothetical protein